MNCRIFLTKFLSDMFYREQSDAMECTYAVNCTDCAAIVVGLANMMGGNLRCERMGNNFLLNPIIPIGNSETGNYNTFIYHETAMRHDGTEDDKNNTVHKVYDASLKINTPTYGYELSVGMSFHNIQMNKFIQAFKMYMQVTILTVSACAL